VPAFNEARSVGAVVEGLRAEGLSVLVVDDGSTNGTAAIARSAGAGVVQLATNLGVGGALRAGIRYALNNGYSQVVQCDGDGQHPAEEVVRLLSDASSQGVHLLVGSRLTAPGSRRGEGFVRRVALGLLALLASRSVGHRVTDSTSGLRVIRRPLLDALAERMPRHYLGDTCEVMVSSGRAGFIVAEIPVAMRDRTHGSSTAPWTAAVGLTLRASLVALLRLHRRFDRLR
jgi:glycosyltransferase involved in cell wall biosynthesis